jgi:hypothetical protein
MRLLLPFVLAVSACQPASTVTSNPSSVGGALTSSTTPSGGKKYALVVGGAEASDQPDDQFGPDFERHVSFLLAAHYDTTVLFGDGLDDLPVQHDSLTQLSSMLGAQPLGFTPDTYQRAASDLLAKAQRGDQVLLTVITHGYECDESIAESQPGGFCVRTGNGQDFSFDNFEPLLDGLAKSEALTGVLVMTCDSGYAMRFGSASICVVSATGHEKSNTLPFLHAFDDHAQAGQSLDAAYTATMIVEPPYDMCDGNCPAGMATCECPPDDQDTPWISSQQGQPDTACAAFTL